MKSTITLKLIICFILIASAILQYHRDKQNSSYPSKYSYLLNNSDVPLTQIKQEFDLPLPLTDDKVSDKDIDWAIKYLRLPEWSSGYVNCRDYQKLTPEQKNSTNHIFEVSCFEIYRAAKTIKNWEENVEKGQTIGEVFVDSNTGQFHSAEDFANALSMLYHGIQIAIAYNRKLTTTLNQYESGGLKLPAVIKNDSDSKTELYPLPTDFQYNSVQFDRIPPNNTIVIKTVSWPQCFYTNHLIAPFLRAHFGYHAAYFLGNYLFGSSSKPNLPVSDPIEYGIEGFLFTGPGMNPPQTFHDKFPRCGFQSTDSIMITNDLNFTGSNAAFYKQVIIFNLDKHEERSKMLYTLMSSKKIVQTFGSVLGFWSNAMQGRKGFYINAIDNICVNLTNSQQGSLIHTYVPWLKKHWMFLSNNHLYLYGDNIHDMELYMNYLLW